MPIDTIDDVLGVLDNIIAQALTEGARFGYFAALYRQVTARVKEGIAAGRFEDGPRMERLDVTFARRYLDSYAAFRAGQPVASCWSIAFRACADPFPCVLQHLLAGMNAHINFDLGVAAADVAPGAAIDSLHGDFLEINKVLAEEAVNVEQALAEVSPALALLSGLSLLTGNRIINFDLVKARDLAWASARGFAANPEDRDDRLARLDGVVSLLGDAVVHPPADVALKLAPIRAVEVHDVRRVIGALARVSGTVRAPRGV